MIILFAVADVIRGLRAYIVVDSTELQGEGPLYSPGLCNLFGRYWSSCRRGCSWSSSLQSFQLSARWAPATTGISTKGLWASLQSQIPSIYWRGSSFKQSSWMKPTIPCHQGCRVVGSYFGFQRHIAILQISGTAWAKL